MFASLSPQQSTCVHFDGEERMEHILTGYILYHVTVILQTYTNTRDEEALTTQEHNDIPQETNNDTADHTEQLSAALPKQHHDKTKRRQNTRKSNLKKIITTSRPGPDSDNDTCH